MLKTYFCTVTLALTKTNPAPALTKFIRFSGRNQTEKNTQLKNALSLLKAEFPQYKHIVVSPAALDMSGDILGVTVTVHGLILETE